jgi:glycosyltransferase involved in cell wall biosynthesis
MERVAVSVIVPCFNGASYLRAALHSVADQHFAEILQICFVDDGSGDDSWAVWQTFCQNTRHQVAGRRFPKNVGAGAARNAAIEMALGDYLCFLDCDDLMHPTRVSTDLSFTLVSFFLFSFQIATQVAAARASASLSLVSCQLAPFPRESPFYERINSLLSENHLRNERFREVGCPLPSWLISRQTFAAVGPFPEVPEVPEDLDWWLRCCAHSEVALVKVAQRLVSYRLHEAQLSHRVSRAALAAAKVPHLSLCFFFVFFFLRRHDLPSLLRGQRGGKSFRFGDAAETASCSSAVCHPQPASASRPFSKSVP